MGQVLHGSATTTEAVRRAIQHSQESLRALAKRYGINPKTVAKWKKRTSVADLPTGPKEPQINRSFPSRTRPSSSRSDRHTLLPLDDCLYALQADDPASDPLVTASLPAAPWHRPTARCRGRQARQEGVQSLSDRLLPYRHRRGADRRRQALPLRRHRPHQQVRLRRSCIEKANRVHRSGLPAALSRPSLQDPHRADRQRHPLHRSQAMPVRQTRPTGAAEPFRAMPSNTPAPAHDIDHRLTKPKHPWTNGQVETHEPHHQGRHRQALPLRQPRPARNHLADFVHAYNFARRLKTLKGLTPYEFICKAWTNAARTIHPQPTPSNAGTKHLGRVDGFDQDQPASKSGEGAVAVGGLVAA